MPKTQDTISFPVKALSLDIAEVNEAGLDHRTPMLSSYWPLDQLAENMVVLPPATVWPLPGLHQLASMLILLPLGHKAYPYPQQNPEKKIKPSNLEKERKKRLPTDFLKYIHFWKKIIFCASMT